MRFSQRIGKTKVREALQIETIDEALENKLWNEIYSLFYNISEKYGEKFPMNIYGEFWLNFMHKKFDEIDYYSSYIEGKVVNTKFILRIIKDKYVDFEWYEKYDFIEFLIHSKFIDDCSEFTVDVNDILKKEMAGYRIIDNKIVQITAEEEIITIEEAINESRNNSVETHLKKALEFLSNRSSPDYRNSVKESISAIEAYCCFMLNDSKATLGNAIKRIEKMHALHPAYKEAFSKLYGYTSDEGGIRHALTEDGVQVTQEDARFMLVTCSAFINYLKVMNSKVVNLD